MQHSSVRPVTGTRLQMITNHLLIVSWCITWKLSQMWVILVMTDVFYKYTLAVPTCDQQHSAVAQVLRTEWFFKVWCPCSYTLGPWPQLWESSTALLPLLPLKNLPQLCTIQLAMGSVNNLIRPTTCCAPSLHLRKITWAHACHRCCTTPLPINHPWLGPKEKVPNFTLSVYSPDGTDLFFVLWVIGWFNSVSNKKHTRHIGNFMFFYWTNKKSGWKKHNSLNSLTPPQAGHQPAYTWLWDGIPFFNQDLSKVSQCGWVSHSSQHVWADPPSVQFGLSSGLLAGHSILSTSTFWS